jgi:site-specific recombinase XerD
VNKTITDCSLGSGKVEKNLKRFMDSLTYEKKSESTKKQYLGTLNQFSSWLLERNKTIETADERDIRDWVQVTKNRTYYYALLKYYEFVNLEVQAKIFRQIINETPKPVRKRIAPLIQWSQFQNYISEVETTSKNKQYIAFLNLLWSEIKSTDIINLKKNNVDFDHKTINVNGKGYYITKEAWIALENYILPEERGKNEKIFKGINSPRYANTIIKDHLGKYKITARNIRMSCEQDLAESGRKHRFVISFAPESNILPFEIHQNNSRP